MPIKHTLVIIPAFNEESSIQTVVREVQAVLAEADVVVVDDGSADSTSQRVLAAGVHLLRIPTNLGVGAALQTGLKFADERGYAYVVRMDGDGQHDPRDARRLLTAIQANQADVVCGSRFLAPAGTGDPAVYTPAASRAMGIRLFARLIGLLTRQAVTDPTSGLYGYNRQVITYLAHHHPQDYPEVESWIMLHRRGFRLLELPTTMRPRRAGNSSITRVKSVYYVLRVLLAALIAMLRAPAPISAENHPLPAPPDPRPVE